MIAIPIPHRVWLLLVFAFSVTVTHHVAAQRPSAPRLLPENTLAYVRIAEVPDLVARFRETATGRMARDEQVQPFVGQLYRSAAEEFSRIEDRVGLSLDQLLAIPQGEFCLALVAPEEGAPELVIVVDVGDHLTQAEALLERVEAELAAQGASRSVETVGETPLVVNELPGRTRSVAYFERQETIVITSNTELAKQLLSLWEGGNEFRTLADNRSFTSIMSRCQGFRDERPQLTWYVNPLELAKRAGRGNFSMQAGLVTLSALGLDGVQAVGGSLILATDQFDVIFHGHLLLKNPRKGVVKMIALDTGEVTPEPWVPKDAASYTTLHWDFAQTYDELERLYDFFRGDGAWRDQVVARFSGQLDLDLEQDLLAALEGRVSWVTWIEKPVRLNSQANLVGLKLVDAEDFRQMLDHVALRFDDRFSRDSHGGTSYYRVATPQQDNEESEPLTRQPEVCAAVLGDYLIVTDSVKLMQEAIRTKNDAARSLADELDFKLIASKIERQLGDAQAGMVEFERPEEGFRLLYDLAASPASRARLATQRDENPVLRALHDALQDHPLPPFAIFAQYLAPGGAMLTSDETGFHYTAFTLRRE